MLLLNRVCTCIALLSILSGCTETNYFDDPYLNAIWQQQAPFGIDTVEVKLKSVFIGGQLDASFQYDRGFLSEIQHYHTFDTLKLIGTKTSYRITSEIQHITNRQPQVIDWEKGKVSEAWIDQGKTTFRKPTSDSIRVVEHETYTTADNATDTYFFNKRGIITKMDRVTPVAPADSYQEIYTRNSLMNIVEATRTSKGNAEATVVTLEYDTHPNPFFQLGFDHQGHISFHSLSPHNVVKMQYTDGAGQKHVQTFSYQYHPNGLPERVEVREVINGKESAAGRETRIYGY